MKLSSKLKTVGKLKTLVRSISICLVFVLLASITATLEAKSYSKQSEMQNLSKSQIECLSKAAYLTIKAKTYTEAQSVVDSILGVGRYAVSSSNF